MAEATKTLKDLSEKAEDIGSRVRSKFEDTKEDIRDNLQESRPLLYAGIGLLALAAGFGVWTIIRRFGPQARSRLETSQDIGMEGFRHS